MEIDFLAGGLGRIAKTMIDRKHELPLMQHAELLGISRELIYYEVPAARALSEALRLIDELHLKAGGRVLRDSTPLIMWSRRYVARVMEREGNCDNLSEEEHQPNTSRPKHQCMDQRVIFGIARLSALFERGPKRDSQQRGSASKAIRETRLLSLLGAHESQRWTSEYPFHPGGICCVDDFDDMSVRIRSQAGDHAVHFLQTGRRVFICDQTFGFH